MLLVAINTVLGARPDSITHAKLQIFASKLSCFLLGKDSLIYELSEPLLVACVKSCFLAMRRTFKGIISSASD